ncbi:S9 family peptidase [Pseudomaricurvus alkylphenolicus]|jgi:dipeptidyl aminopeptidase/acylaminoacyl peptidase|uniref:S9 family peptidase n=1 Tax=Pseudomaricurvus alkylphenolicus TaxID=1306991 RepID=UPI00141E7C98|nr:S9 family peptidase [Pseudomaricurvus alkylphenolicus]NIB39804.1 S9 family peptidase [Pseudomaricurvus alkylphenolicus]
MTTILPYGSWPSDIHSEMLTRQSVRLGEPRLYGDATYWVESRPQEQGRSVLMCKRPNQSAQEVLPRHCDVRTKAHEYGGSSYCVDGDDVYFVQSTDQRVYRASGDSEPVAITPEGPWRYADFCLDSERQRLLCLREDHTCQSEGIEETNQLVAIDINGAKLPTVIAEGHDFFSNPRLSPDGSQLSWLCWDHPCMPWDSSEAWLADIDDSGMPTNACKVAGGAGESIFQPQWSPGGQLYLVSDRNDWWNIYRLGAEGELEPVVTKAAEFATPQWVFGMSTYGFLSASEILACYTHGGQWHLATIDTESGTLIDIESPFCDVGSIQCLSGRAAFLAASPTRTTDLLAFDGAEFQRLASSSGDQLPAELISTAQAITFDTGKGAQAHGFYYAPRNGDISGPQGGTPPLVVLCHGGPTGATETGLNLKIQYWTSRGFAVMDVNYRGSTGYGRHYREQLNRAWGLHDVEDVCAAADHLVAQGLANPDQLAIKGSSAGGYTVLAALTFSDTFKAGASLYGIGDLETLACDTHKFESRYLDSLVGAYPEEKTLYLERSPIHHADRLNCPVIFFQGLDDKVVPPNQAESMVSLLDEKQVPVAYVPFEGEGHGFRKASSIQRCLEAEWSFYGQVFGFDVPTEINPVAVRNLNPSPNGDGS